MGRRTKINVTVFFPINIFCFFTFLSISNFLERLEKVSYFKFNNKLVNFGSKKIQNFEKKSFFEITITWKVQNACLKLRQILKSDKFRKKKNFIKKWTNLKKYYNVCPFSKDCAG